MNFIEVWEKEENSESFWNDKYKLPYKLLGRASVFDLVEANEIVNENFDFSEYMVYYVQNCMGREEKTLIRS